MIGTYAMQLLHNMCLGYFAIVSMFASEHSMLFLYVYVSRLPHHCTQDQCLEPIQCNSVVPIVADR